MDSTTMIEETSHKPQEEAPATYADRADELLAAFAEREVLIYTPVAQDGAARMLAEALGRDEYGNKQLVATTVAWSFHPLKIG